jgi:imidazolonepropionase-like amidohydrolase
MVVVRCGALIDGTGRAPIANATVGIENGRIAWVREDGSVPSGETPIDAREYPVLPGVIDAQAHLGVDTGDERAQSLEPDAWTTIKATYNARCCLASGITTLRDVGEKNHLDLLWRDALEQGMMTGPRILVSGKFITITGGHAWYFGTEVDSVDDIKRAVRNEAKEGVDLIKVMVTGGAGTKGTEPMTPALTEEEIRAAVVEASRLSLPVAVHAYGGAAARAAIEAGVHSVEHGSFLTREELDLMAEKGIFLVVTYGVIQFAAASPDVPDFMREKCKQIIEAYMDTLREAKSSGVRVAVGTDGYHAHLLDEVKALREAGYSTMEAIQAATAGGAAVCQLEREVGTIEPGKVADLIAVAGNPLEDLNALGQVRLVMHNGRVYSPEALVS